MKCLYLRQSYKHNRHYLSQFAFSVKMYSLILIWLLPSFDFRLALFKTLSALNFIGGVFIHFIVVLLFLKNITWQILYHSITFIYYSLQNDTFFNIFSSLRYPTKLFQSQVHRHQNIVDILSSKIHYSFPFDNVTSNVLNVVIHISLIQPCYRWFAKYPSLYNNTENFGRFSYLSYLWAWNCFRFTVPNLALLPRLLCLEGSQKNWNK